MIMTRHSSTDKTHN